MQYLVEKHIGGEINRNTWGEINQSRARGERRRRGWAALICSAGDQKSQPFKEGLGGRGSFRACSTSNIARSRNPQSLCRHSRHFAIDLISLCTALLMTQQFKVNQLRNRARLNLILPLYIVESLAEAVRFHIEMPILWFMSRCLRNDLIKLKRDSGQLWGVRVPKKRPWKLYGVDPCLIFLSALLRFNLTGAFTVPNMGLRHAPKKCLTRCAMVVGLSWALNCVNCDKFGNVCKKYICF